MKKITLTSLPKSWWAIYTEALLNSRELKTEFQEWRDSMRETQRFVRSVEDAVFRNSRFGSLGNQEKPSA